MKNKLYKQIDDLESQLKTQKTKLEESSQIKLKEGAALEIK